MTTIQVRVPKAIEQLVEGEQDRLLRVGLRVAAKKRAQELAQSKREALLHVRQMERKYGVTFRTFEKKMDKEAALQLHEDYNEWYFWMSVLARVKQAQSAMDKLQSAT